MRKMLLLPKKRGFTLIELLVTISIISILVTIGIVVFSVVQKNGRDAKRMGDIDTIAGAILNNYTVVGPGSGNVGISSTNFASGGIPTDPQVTRKYCFNSNAGASIGEGAWTSGCPDGWVEISDTSTFGGDDGWKICAFLENKTGIEAYYCKRNIQ